jgi:hypothetical protein
VAAFLQAGKETSVVDPVAAQLDIVRRIMSAESIADVLEQTEAIHAKDVLDTPIIVQGFRYQESDLEGGGIGFYMLLDCVTPQGEPYTITCGAVNVMAQLHRLNELGGLPIVGEMREVGKATRNGYKPMWFAKEAGF